MHVRTVCALIKELVVGIHAYKAMGSLLISYLPVNRLSIHNYVSKTDEDGFFDLDKRKNKHLALN